MCLDYYSDKICVNIKYLNILALPFWTFPYSLIQLSQDGPSYKLRVHRL